MVRSLALASSRRYTIVIMTVLKTDTVISVAEYLLVSQDRREVTVTRRANGWEPEVLVGDGFGLALSCGGCPATIIIDLNDN